MKYTDPYAWSATTIGYILKRPEYEGCKILGKTVSESYKKSKNCKTAHDEQYIFDGAIPIIVDEENGTTPNIYGKRYAARRSARALRTV